MSPVTRCSIAPAGPDLALLDRLVARPLPFAPHEAPFWDDPHIGQRTWSLCSEGGFWREGSYLALTTSYHYPALDAEVDQIVVLDTGGRTRAYRNWNRGYTPESVAPVLERTGFQLISTWGDLEGSPHGATDALGVVAIRD